MDSNYTIADAMDCVSRGIKFMIDKGYEKDLLDIDLSEFDMTSDEYCVVGNIFGSFEEDYINLGINKHECALLGFISPNGSAFNNKDYSLLQEAWIFALNNMQKDQGE